MWIEEVRLKDIRCFNDLTLRLGTSEKPYKWVTLLGENGMGKSTVLRAIGIMLGIAYRGLQTPAYKVLFSILNQEGRSKITSRINQENVKSDSFFISRQLNNQFDISSFKVSHALLFQKSFSVGYGAFRRLSTEDRILIPSLPKLSVEDNFSSLFDEDKPLAAFEHWMVYLEFQIAKNPNNTAAQKQKAIAIKAINDLLLPTNSKLIEVDAEGRVWFETPEGKQPTIALSDGYRSILALSGDLIWRLINAFPDSDNPLEEEGVVLIDELDIHLHPTWQRQIAFSLQTTFPNIQFIVATHSPIIALGAGSQAVTYKFYRSDNGSIEAEQIEDIYAYDVERILQSEAFGQTSTFSLETQAHIDKYYALRSKKVSGEKLSEEEEKQYQATLPFVRQALGYGSDKSELNQKIEAF